MPSAAYQIVSSHGFEPLGSYGWLHSLKTGQVNIPDLDERGDKGPILHLFLGVDRKLWPRTIGPVENEGFHPDPSHEALVIWLLESGADPWDRHKGRNAWSEALYRGWPSVMRYLCSRPDAPPREVLEQELVYRDHGRAPNGGKPGAGLVAPAAFAERDQIDVLKAWADLGFSVNLGMDQELNAGTRARTPKFLAEWARLGGAITSNTVKGEPLKSAWHFTNAAHQVDMERVWAKHQPADSRPIDARIDEALALILKGTPKTLVTHRLRELGLTAQSSRENGTMMWELWAEKHLEDPARTSPAVALMMLEGAPDEIVWRAAVEGLKRAGDVVNQFFPTPRHMDSILSSGRFGSVAEVLYRLADEVADYPKAMRRLFAHSRKHVQKLAPNTEQQDRKPGVDALDVLTPYWGGWFFHPDDPPGQHRGWRAFAAHIARGDETSVASQLYQAILSRSGDYSSLATEGIDLLIAAQAKEDLKGYVFPSALFKQWDEGGTLGWLEGYDLQAPGSTNSDLVWEIWESLLAEGKYSNYRESIRSLMVKLSEKQMEAQIPHSDPGPERAPRFRF